MFEVGNLNYNFQSFLDMVGLIQGTTLGVLLIVLNKRKYRSTFFLGLFLIFLSLKLVSYIAISLQVSDVYPTLFLLPFNFSWLLLPLFFVYTQQVCALSNEKTHYWVLIPGVVSFLAQLVIFFLPYETKLMISQSPWYVLIFTYIGIFYSLAIGVWNLRLLYHHRIEVHNSFSLIESKELQWARVFLIYSLITTVIIHILFYISTTNYYFKILFSVFDLIAIYWVSYHGVVQRNVLSVLDERGRYHIPLQVPSETVNTTTTATEELEALMEKIDNHMVRSESFIHTELTIVDLAEKLKVHPKRISTAINTIRQQNFNTYVNRFRIKKAEQLLRNQEEIHLSIEGIGNEVGFHSKSAFYSAFKKETGTTPTKYKEKISA
ncbi:helix-turn-helix transcriptional regulator [Flavobacteriaceae bacterium TP-CH-4]|uniref:Helix-turn-helix transcriptional regulator n=1 Tax=Pelagihabitans pacificus TaxID=2696054 RepID=A0A967AQF6_9FLAO|nr:helix-turn-helix domain-containing protein [Pelagihabitans pacificus]NHF58087.1 helix-turn-helix transcriptional regulator [Pelagihabitans pacificus]